MLIILSKSVQYDISTYVYKVLLEQDRKTREVKEMGDREETLHPRDSFVFPNQRESKHLIQLRLEPGVV